MILVIMMAVVVVVVLIMVLLMLVMVVMIFAVAFDSTAPTHTPNEFSLLLSESVVPTRRSSGVHTQDRAPAMNAVR